MKEYKYTINGNSYNVAINEVCDTTAKVTVNGAEYTVEWEKPVEEKPVVRPIRKQNPSLQEIDLLLSASYDNYTIDDYKALKEMLMKKKAANQQRITRNDIETKKYQQLKEIYESAN